MPILVPASMIKILKLESRYSKSQMSARKHARKKKRKLVAMPWQVFSITVQRNVVYMYYCWSNQCPGTFSFSMMLMMELGTDSPQTLEISCLPVVLVVSWSALTFVSIDV